MATTTDQGQASNLELHLDLQHGWQHPKKVIIFCLPGHVSREPDREQSSLDYNWRLEWDVGTAISSLAHGAATPTPF